jgi:mannose-6-phosphate isomerase-like protein (cupin superfamily)
MPRNTRLVHAHDLNEIANRPLSVADGIEDASAGWLGDGFQHVRWHGSEHMASRIYVQAYVRMTRAAMGSRLTRTSAIRKEEGSSSHCSETDDFFLAVSDHLTIHLRDRDVELDPGELFVVPRGVEHCPDAAEETEVLLIEPDGTVNTVMPVAT